MNILYLLIGLALLLMSAAVGLFLWTVRNSQYEDLDGPAHRILLDDDDSRIPKANRGQGVDDRHAGPDRLRQ